MEMFFTIIHHIAASVSFAVFSPWTEGGFSRCKNWLEPSGYPGKTDLRGSRSIGKKRGAAVRRRREGFDSSGSFRRRRSVKRFSSVQENISLILKKISVFVNIFQRDAVRMENADKRPAQNMDGRFARVKNLRSGIFLYTEFSTVAF